MTLEQIKNFGRPLRADAERNRRRILAAAAEVFAKRGLDAGLDEIARRAGVGTGTVYRRFPNKSVLIVALFESRIDALVEVAERASAMSDPWTGLVQFLETSIEMQQADRGLKELLFGECHSPQAQTNGSRFAAKFENLIAAIAAIVERAQAAGQLRPDISVTDLAIGQFMIHEVGRFTASVEPQLWRRQLAILLDGLRTRRETATPLPLAALCLDQFKTLCLPSPVTETH
jgi:AcrR family transcriptional regulator